LRLVVAVVAALMMWASGAVAPAVADTPGCITYSEFNHLQRGISLATVQRRLLQPGTYAGGGQAAWQYVFSECWDRGAQAELFFSVDVNYGTHLDGKQWNADLSSSHAVSLFEAGMMDEWLQIGRSPTRAVVERIFEVRGRTAEGGDYYYPVARVAEWDAVFGNREGGYTVYVRYRDGHMTRIYHLRTVG
jgi:hypothetical protein